MAAPAIALNISTNSHVCNDLTRFDWPDYLVLASMLIISSGIGLFYGFFGPKHKTASDFLLGGSSMGTFPMAMSLAARCLCMFCCSFITAIELLGNPVEMYNHGTQFWMTCVAFFLVAPITSYLYLPVYHDLQLTSAYELKILLIPWVLVYTPPVLRDEVQLRDPHPHVGHVHHPDGSLHVSSSVRAGAGLESW
uniref:Uncharacterized protein n=1 Tax=Timema shepardi TaxID=629360 RepID=A0A7R9FVD7_TIMSH|nr:unnamed protein product [Timema shepardi]